MDDKKENHLDYKNKIINHYSLVDKNTINTLCANDNLKNLILLSTKTDINVFNKKYKKWQLKDRDKLLKECEQIKKKELKNSSLMLSNLAKLNQTNETIKVQDICSNLEDRMTNLDQLIGCINNIESFKIQSNQMENINNLLNDSDKSDKLDINIVSFDPLFSKNEVRQKIKKEKQFKIKIVNESNNENNLTNLCNLSSLIVEQNMAPPNINPMEYSDSFIECYSNC